MMQIRAKLMVPILSLAVNVFAAEMPQAGFDAKAETATGLHVVTFTTPAGRIKINLPDDRRPADTISGTIVLTPLGTTPEVREANAARLGAHEIELAGQRQRVDSPVITVTLPAAFPPAGLGLGLKDASGTETTRIQLPAATRPGQTPRAFRLPEVGQNGRLIEIAGPFDGDFSTTELKLEDEILALVAESPRKLIAGNSFTKAGMRLLLLRERDRNGESDFRSVAISLAAPKTALVRDDTTTLTVTIHGLAGLSKPIPFVLENASSDVISISGGDLVRFQVGPADVSNGGYTLERSVTGIKRGSWSISCSLAKGE